MVQSPNNSLGTTLVFGARGSVGRHVLNQLVIDGEPVRASVRKLATADFPLGVPVVEADLENEESIKLALEGISRVFLYSAPKGIEGFIKIAQSAGVKNVVLMSSGSILLPAEAGNAIAEEHRFVEDALASSGLAWTPIRPLVLANNAMNWSYSIRGRGTVSLVYPEAPMSPIHERDIAEVVVAALRGRSDAVVSEILTGRELTQRQQVEILSKTIGKPIQIIELTESEGLQFFGRFVPPHVAKAIVDISASAMRGGSPSTDTAFKVLGRQALSFSQWATDHAPDFS